MTIKGRNGSTVRAKLLSMAVLGGMTAISAHAIDFNTGNPDVGVNWNNTIRYNYARRMQSPNPHIAQSPNFDQSDALFANKGDMINNRLDWLTELNFFYQAKHGFRVSAAAWYDDAYGNKGKSYPGLDASSSYRNNDFTNVVKRYYHGPSGELLDAFVFTNFSLGDATVNARLGRHAIIWGEGLFGSTHSIAYSQAPSDGRKSVTSPGASAKETALPIEQVSTNIVVNSEVTLMGQYQFEWKANRIPEGGTFFAGADVIMEGPNVGRTGPLKGEKGAYGVGIKYTPSWLGEGTIGAYYRKFDDTGGWAAQLQSLTPVTTGAVYAQDMKLWGLTFARQLFGVSMAAEVSHRSNGPLNSSGAAPARQRFEGAVGDTWHALVNGVMTFGGTPLWGSASLVGEIAWSELDKVTRNPNLYKTAGGAAVCRTNLADINGCVTKPFRSIGAQFAPAWPQAYPGVDLSMPLFVSRNFGNAPSNGGGSDGFSVYKMGLSATVNTVHLIDISYTKFVGKSDYSVIGRLLGAPYGDKGNLSITYQTTF